MCVLEMHKIQEVHVCVSIHMNAFWSCTNLMGTQDIIRIFQMFREKYNIMMSIIEGCGHVLIS